MHNMFPTLCAAYIEHRRGWLETLRNFVAERMNREVSLWTPIKIMVCFLLETSNSWSGFVTSQSTLKKQRSLWPIDDISVIKRDTYQKYAKVNFYFTLTRRLLFALNGSSLLCEDKSTLVHCLEKTQNEINKNKQLNLSKNPIKVSEVPQISKDKIRKIAIVDCMVLVQQMTKKEQLVLLKI